MRITYITPSGFENLSVTFYNLATPSEFFPNYFRGISSSPIPKPIFQIIAFHSQCGSVVRSDRQRAQ